MTTPAVMPSAGFPFASGVELSEDEKVAAQGLAHRLFAERPLLELSGFYYDGLQRMEDLGISIPPALSKIRTVTGWGGIGVDAIANRCRVEGFRYPDDTDTDDDLWAMAKANRLQSELPLAFLDAFIYGRSYGIVGTNPDPSSGQPLMTVESPLNMIAAWDPRSRRCTSALQIYVDGDFTSETYGMEVAGLYLLGRTILLTRQPVAQGSSAKAQEWTVATRDDHGLSRVPVVRFTNRQRTGNRTGQSEIRPSWRNTIDSACRTLLGMEVTREFYGAPRRYILGAAEDAFQKADGTSVTAWEAYLNKVWAVERDEEGNVPTVGEFKAGDPATHTKLLDTYAKIMSGEMGVPPHFLGIFSDGNPASADAIRSGYEELTMRSTHKHLTLGDDSADFMRLGLLVRDGVLPANADLLEVDWMDPRPETMSATADAITKQIQSGAIPAHSDVTLKHLGYTAVERARLEIDRKADEGEQLLAQIAHSLTTKDMRAEGVLQKNDPAIAPAVPFSSAA